MPRKAQPELGASVDTFTLVAPDEVAPEGEFTKVYELFSTKILRDIGGMNVEAKILLWMLANRGQMQFSASGYMDCTQSMVAIAIGVKRNAVCMSMLSLKERGYIEQLKPRSSVWRIRPELAFRGKLSSYWKAKPKSNPYGVDVYCPWSPADYAKMKAGEQPLPGLEELPVPKAM